MEHQIDLEQQTDGRWIAKITSLPGLMAYGASRTDAESKVEATALRVIADRIERDNTTAQVHFASAIA